MSKFRYTQVSQLYVNRVYVRNDEREILERSRQLTI